MQTESLLSERPQVLQDQSLGMKCMSSYLILPQPTIHPPKVKPSIHFTMPHSSEDNEADRHVS